MARPRGSRSHIAEEAEGQLRATKKQLHLQKLSLPSLSQNDVITHLLLTLLALQQMQQQILQLLANI